LTVLYSEEKVGGQVTALVTFCENNAVFREKERNPCIEGLLHVNIDKHLSGFPHAWGRVRRVTGTIQDISGPTAYDTVFQNALC
jgi:hypothetical protein